MSTPVILCSGDVWELRKRAEDLEQIAGVHVRVKPFEVDDMSELVTRLLEEAGRSPATRQSRQASP